MRRMCIILTFHFGCVYMCVEIFIMFCSFFDAALLLFARFCYCLFYAIHLGRKKTQNLQSSSSLEASSFITWVEKEKKISADWNFSRVFGMNEATCFNDECLDKLLLGDLSFVSWFIGLKSGYGTSQSWHVTLPRWDFNILFSDIYRHIWKCNLILIIVTQAHNLRWIWHKNKKTQVASCQAFKSNYTRFEPLLWNCPIGDRFACCRGDFVCGVGGMCRDLLVGFDLSNVLYDVKIVLIRTHKWFVFKIAAVVLAHIEWESKTHDVMWHFKSNYFAIISWLFHCLTLNLEKTLTSFIVTHAQPPEDKCN